MNIGIVDELVERSGMNTRLTSLVRQLMQSSPDALAEAIIKVLRNRDLARGFSDAGRKRFEKEFTLEIMVKRYCEAYEP